MRASPRFMQGNRGAGDPAVPALVPPETPHHPKSGAALQALIGQLEKRWHLGLKTGDDPKSPARNRSQADKIQRKLQYMFYRTKPALDDALEIFEKSAIGSAPEKRLELLEGILKSKSSTPHSRTGTPFGPRHEPPPNLVGK